MSRKRLVAKVKSSLAESHLDTDQAARFAADIAIDCTLEYLMRYSELLSEELMHTGLYSESMTAGTIRNKIKSLLDGTENNA